MNILRQAELELVGTIRLEIGSGVPLLLRLDQKSGDPK